MSKDRERRLDTIHSTSDRLTELARRYDSPRFLYAIDYRKWWFFPGVLVDCGPAYRTKEDAIADAKKMLETIEVKHDA